MPKFMKKLLSWIDQLLDSQPAAEPEPAEPIDFETFFTEDLYAAED